MKAGTVPTVHRYQQVGIPTQACPRVILELIPEILHVVAPGQIDVGGPNCEYTFEYHLQIHVHNTMLASINRQYLNTRGRYVVSMQI